ADAVGRGVRDVGRRTAGRRRVDGEPSPPRGDVEIETDRPVGIRVRVEAETDEVARLVALHAGVQIAATEEAVLPESVEGPRGREVVAEVPLHREAARHERRLF